MSLDLLEKSLLFSLVADHLLLSDLQDAHLQDLSDIDLLKICNETGLPLSKVLSDTLMFKESILNSLMIINLTKYEIEVLDSSSQTQDS